MADDGHGVAGVEPVGDDDGGIGIAEVVFLDQRQVMSADPARRVDLLDRHPGAQHHRPPDRIGEGTGHADRDQLRGTARRDQDQACGQNALQ